MIQLLETSNVPLRMTFIISCLLSSLVANHYGRWCGRGILDTSDSTHYRLSYRETEALEQVCTFCLFENGGPYDNPDGRSLNVVLYGWLRQEAESTRWLID